MRLIIVSGLSGSGKTIAIQTLEDLGYYCVDNLPLQLLEPCALSLQARATAQGEAQLLAVGIDARNFLDLLDEFSDSLAALCRHGIDTKVLFLQASDEALLQRYNETRRKHPLALNNQPLLEAIRQERQLLGEIAAYADVIIDTSRTNLHELRERIRSLVYSAHSNRMTLLFESFGFKNGNPIDADFVFDVRCLPNPHWDRKLRLLTGLDRPVCEFLESQTMVQDMLTAIGDFLEIWIPDFDTGNRSYMTVAIGCTGGQHRSVYIASKLAERFSQHRTNVMTRHREFS